jgi:DNA-binding NtrC family response regulator
MRAGAIDFLVKPLDLHDLRRVLRRVFDDRRTRARADASRTAHGPPDPLSLGDLVGRDPRMIEIYKVIGQVAATRANVLIRGESGTGKELIAHAIHLHSADGGEPFVPVNCTALPATLLESELFGHVRGSFTGAQSDRRGRFALAGRGSIFLDEIGDTSPEFQTKLLRVLQERQFYPVGADRPERTDARVIAATHRNLESMVESGEFRGDLYYRLRVVEIRVPPLRERPLDLPLLAQALVRRASDALGCPVPVLAADALAALARHHWPGNVRELENCLTRAIVVAAGNVVHAEDLTLGEQGSVAPAATLVTLDEWERVHVERVLAATGGQKAQAARVLGVSRPRLDRLLKKHGLL